SQQRFRYLPAQAILSARAVIPDNLPSFSLI
ncbi:hypothetical protein FOQG_19177, partial [Fusarium oxysporum f. sp. raphani 54005]